MLENCQVPNAATPVILIKEGNVGSVLFRYQEEIVDRVRPGPLQAELRILYLIFSLQSTIYYSIMQMPFQTILRIAANADRS